jgi:hypothetical protein
VLQTAHNIKEIEHNDGSPTANLKEAIEIIKEFLPDPIKAALLT